MKEVGESSVRGGRGGSGNGGGGGSSGSGGGGNGFQILNLQSPVIDSPTSTTPMEEENSKVGNFCMFFIVYLD